MSSLPGLLTTRSANPSVSKSPLASTGPPKLNPGTRCSIENTWSRLVSPGGPP